MPYILWKLMGNKWLRKCVARQKGFHCVQVCACVCAHIQMVNWSLWYYYFSLSVTHWARLTEPYLLLAHMLSLPFLTWQYTQSQLSAAECLVSSVWWITSFRTQNTWYASLLTLYMSEHTNDVCLIHISSALPAAAKRIYFYAHSA